MAVGKRPDPLVDEVEVALTSMPGLSKRRVLEDAVLCEKVCAVGEAPLVEAIVVLADEEMRCCHVRDNYKAYHAPCVP